MITPALLDDLHILRSKHCQCGAVMVMPQFHDGKCPYKSQGESVITVAEKEESDVLE